MFMSVYDVKIVNVETSHTFILNDDFFVDVERLLGCVGFFVVSLVFVMSAEL